MSKMLVSPQSSVSVPASCLNFMTLSSSGYMQPSPPVLTPTPNPEMLSWKDMRNGREFHRSARTLVGGKTNDGILIKHLDGEVGGTELRGKRGLRQSVSSVMTSSWEPGSYCCHLYTGYFAPGTKGSHVLFSRNVSRLISCHNPFSTSCSCFLCVLLQIKLEI